MLKDIKFPIYKFLRLNIGDENSREILVKFYGNSIKQV